MPSYSWSCLACGATNAAALEHCATCHCPALCTVREIEAYRTVYSSSGSSVGPAAGLLRDDSDITGLQFVFGVIALLFLGWWPYDWHSRSE